MGYEPTLVPLPTDTTLDFHEIQKYRAMSPDKISGVAVCATCKKYRLYLSKNTLTIRNLRIMGNLTEIL